MPLVRYEIRSEYELANRELFRSAPKNDPEAILEGVAMVSLVGIVRQLGDLAEFAADIFHELHESLMATAARSHELSARVSQLEAELPALEKLMLSRKSNPLQFAYSPGVDWHASIRNDQNHCTQGDLPRFIRSSYEECRGPPRLFLLDKFDVGGVGACLKRYTDPSFFKTEWASSELMKAEKAQQDKQSRRSKRTRRRREEPVKEVKPPVQLQTRTRYSTISMSSLDGLSDSTAPLNSMAVESTDQASKPFPFVTFLGGSQQSSSTEARAKPKSLEIVAVEEPEEKVLVESSGKAQNEDAASETEQYLDAMTTMESESDLESRRLSNFRAEAEPELVARQGYDTFEDAKVSALDSETESKYSSELAPMPVEAQPEGSELQEKEILLEAEDESELQEKDMLLEAEDDAEKEIRLDAEDERAPVEALPSSEIREAAFESFEKKIDTIDDVTPEKLEEEEEVIPESKEISSEAESEEKPLLRTKASSDDETFDVEVIQVAFDDRELRNGVEFEQLAASDSDSAPEPEVERVSEDILRHLKLHEPRDEHAFEEDIEEEQEQDIEDDLLEEKNFAKNDEIEKLSIEEAPSPELEKETIASNEYESRSVQVDESEMKTAEERSSPAAEGNGRADGGSPVSMNGDEDFESASSHEDFFIARTSSRFSDFSDEQSLGIEAEEYFGDEESAKDRSPPVAERQEAPQNMEPKLEPQMPSPEAESFSREMEQDSVIIPAGIKVEQEQDSVIIPAGIKMEQEQESGILPAGIKMEQEQDSGILPAGIKMEQEQDTAIATARNEEHSAAIVENTGALEEMKLPGEILFTLKESERRESSVDDHHGPEEVHVVAPGFELRDEEDDDENSSTGAMALENELREEEKPAMAMVNELRKEEEEESSPRAITLEHELRDEKEEHPSTRAIAVEHNLRREEDEGEELTKDYEELSERVITLEQELRQEVDEDLSKGVITLAQEPRQVDDEDSSRGMIEHELGRVDEEESSEGVIALEHELGQVEEEDSSKGVIALEHELGQDEGVFSLEHELGQEEEQEKESSSGMTSMSSSPRSPIFSALHAPLSPPAASSSGERSLSGFVSFLAPSSPSQSSASFSLEGMPPLPPLPPLRWRTPASPWHTQATALPTGKASGFSPDPEHMLEPEFELQQVRGASAEPQKALLSMLTGRTPAVEAEEAQTGASEHGKLEAFKVSDDSEVSEREALDWRDNSVFEAEPRRSFSHRRTWEVDDSSRVLLLGSLEKTREQEADALQVEDLRVERNGHARELEGVDEPEDHEAPAASTTVASESKLEFKLLDERKPPTLSFNNGSEQLDSPAPDEEVVEVVTKPEAQLEKLASAALGQQHSEGKLLEPEALLDRRLKSTKLHELIQDEHLSSLALEQQVPEPEMDRAARSSLAGDEVDHLASPALEQRIEQKVLELEDRKTEALTLEEESTSRVSERLQERAQTLPISTMPMAQSPDTEEHQSDEQKLADSPHTPGSRVKSPKDPADEALIQAISSHDKAKLKRVPSDTPTPKAGERDVLLEQIRSQSFNLRHTVVEKKETKEATPRIVSNINVAAILEKANAIRQAFAGTDDEEEDDDWSE